MLKEKRSSERFSLNSPIRYYLKGDNRVNNTIGRDISNSGIGFVSGEFIPMHKDLIFELLHHMTGEPIVKVGKVIWGSRHSCSDRFSIGAKFLEPLNLEEMEIKDYSAGSYGDNKKT